jgi:CHAT domain-containing protein/Flp pilus assembly protein TadD
MKIVPNGRCIGDQEFYEYIAGKGGEPDANIQAHLSSCSQCRQSLAELMRIMDEIPSAPAEDPDPLEIKKALAAIQRVSRSESNNKLLYIYGSIAAGVILAIGLSLTGFDLYNRTKSQSYCNRARAYLQQVYQAQSPNDLRLDLPFQSEVSQRSTAGNTEAINSAERLFNQALGVREGMAEALLGLGYLDLQKSQFKKAELEFQQALESQPSNSQALLGRGVSRFEEGLIAADPTARRDYLDKALADFESILKSNPRSSEARYNKIQVLYNTGRHKEALREIDTYLSHDSGSIWAAKLKDLRIRIQMNSWDLLYKEIHRAALARNAQYLDTIVRIVPEKIRVAVVTIFRDALAAEGRPPMNGEPDSNSLQWAANHLAQSYQTNTGDDACAHMISFYAGLSPPQRQIKKKLDARLEQLIKLYDKNEFQAALTGSGPLLRDFETLRDYWQLVRLHHLRGSSRYYWKADFSASNRGYREMLKSAELTGNSDLIARSLQCLASSYSGMGQFENEFECLSKLEGMARTPQMNYLSAYIFDFLGTAYLNSNQIDASLHHFLSCLAYSYRLMDSQHLIYSLENIGVIMERKGKYSDAAKYYDECIRWLKIAIADGLQRANSEVETRLTDVQNMLGNLAIKMKHFEAAETQFREALRNHPNRFLEASSRIGLARAYFEEKKFTHAEAEVDKALDLTAKNPYYEIAWKANNLKGMLLKRRGNEKGALPYFTQATQTIETTRTALPTLDLRQSFFSERFDPYRNIVSLLYSKKNPLLVLSYVDRAKSMSLRESLNLQSGSIANKEQRGDAAGSDPNRQLPPGISILEYFFGINELFAFSSGKAGDEAFSIPTTAPDMEKLVREFLESIKNNDTPSYDRLSRKLYGILVEPILRNKQSEVSETLIILADGPLHMLPFGALIDNKGRFLLEKYAISYSPSRSVLHYCLDKHKSGKITAQSSILLMDGASNLRGAGREIASITNLYKTTRLISDPDSPSLDSLIGDFEIIHFSGHAELHMGSPRLVFRTPSGEKYLDSQAFQKWKLKNNKLVTLAGCNTGVGPIFDGETPWSLAPSLLSAGAPSILVSLLPVDDFATASLTSRFYELLAHGDCSKAQALRSAQLSLLNSEARHSPASWVPFVLIGNPN